MTKIPLLCLVLLTGLCVRGRAAAVEPGLHPDIEYGRAGETRLLLDASVPAGPGPYPVVILIHGGGWSSGDKTGGQPPGAGADIRPWFALLGHGDFVWFSINYRLAPAQRWPACFEDVQTAVRWVKAHAAEFKGDPARIAVFGHSAGGQLALLLGTLADATVRVQAVVGFAPVSDFEFELPTRGGLSPALQQLLHRPPAVTAETLAVLRELAPINHVRPGLPAFLLVHGDADRTVPYQTSLNFQALVRASGGVCDLITLPGAGHGLTKWGQFLPDYPVQVRQWLQRQLPPPAGSAVR